MGFDIEPHPEISGDIWFHEGELDVDFIETLTKIVYDFIEENVFSALLSLALSFCNLHFIQKVASISEIFSGLKGKIATSIKVSHIQELLNLLKWDGKLEPFEDLASGVTFPQSHEGFFVNLDFFLKIEF